MNFETQEEYNPDKLIYENAQEMALEFLHDIDPGLRVEVSHVSVNPTKGETYDSFSLRFTHEDFPAMEWTMELGDDEEYYSSGKFEKVVRKIYQNQKSNILQ